ERSSGGVRDLVDVERAVKLELGDGDGLLGGEGDGVGGVEGVLRWVERGVDVVSGDVDGGRGGGLREEGGRGEGGEQKSGGVSGLDPDLGHSTCGLSFRCDFFGCSIWAAKLAARSMAVSLVWALALSIAEMSRRLVFILSR